MASETIADIAAALRHNSKGLMFYFRTNENGSTHAMGADYVELADRIEAAAKRAYNDIDSIVCGIEGISHYDIDDVRMVMEKTIGDYYE